MGYYLVTYRAIIDKEQVYDGKFGQQADGEPAIPEAKVTIEKGCRRLYPQAGTLKDLVLKMQGITEPHYLSIVGIQKMKSLKQKIIAFFTGS